MLGLLPLKTFSFTIYGSMKKKMNNDNERRARWMIDSYNNHFLFLHVVCLQASFSHYQDDCGCDSFTGITYFLF